MHMQKVFILVTLLVSLLNTSAQFIDNFNGTGTPKGWTFKAGDGSATMDFKQHNGMASIYVDATHDTLGIWWALIRHTLPGIDIKKLSNLEYVLRIETRIRVSHAPRRVNLHVNNQRTTDFHSNLMEFDIDDTANWHTISMTARDFETRLGDTVACQLALMDWGLEKYRVDMDYLKANVVKRDSAGADLGGPIPYHPPIADPSSFPLQFDVKQDAMVDTQFPDLNFNNWTSHGASGEYINLLTVSGTQYVIMRWDFSALKGKKVKRGGLLEMSPYSVQRSPEFKKDFGMVHVVEILGGDPLWDEKTVTFNKLKAGLPLEKVINAQMIIDDSLTWNKNGKVFFTISQPVLQRLIDGKTLGIVIKPLGAVNASFYSKDADKTRAPRLYLDVE